MGTKKQTTEKLFETMTLQFVFKFVHGATIPKVFWQLIP